MTPLEAPDRDWWMPHVAIAAFGLLVTAILAAVPGWSAALQVWTTLAALVLCVLALHATARAAGAACRRRWRLAAFALLLAAALGAVAGAMLRAGPGFVESGCDGVDGS